ncbi:MAG: T9SS type A sorting domain-containing protein [Chitinophagales bacterium]|nr:T9SS type A sorting domain-containing protein [Chitinophagales bacterium]
MKYFTFLITFLLISFQLSAQITVERSDYTLTPDEDIVGWVIEETSIEIPNDGPNQTWDFSGITLDYSYTYQKNLGSNPNLPEATLTDSTSFPLLDIAPQQVIFYEELTEDYHSTVGRYNDAVLSTLQAFTGNSGDSLNAQPNLVIYEEPSVFVQFPLNYGDSWSSELSIDGNYSVTIQSFGLDHVPGNAVGHFDITKTVTGYGNLILPDPEGAGTISVEALMVKENATIVDSFFLGGQPAPLALLTAFGLEQGKTVNRIDYGFYAKGLPRTALFIVVEDGVVIDAHMSDDVKNLVSSTRDENTFHLASKVFPNPTNGMFQLEFEKNDGSDWTLELYNSTGQLVHQQIINGMVGLKMVNVQFDANAAMGIYQYRLENAKGQLMSAGKVVLE